MKMEYFYKTVVNVTHYSHIGMFIQQSMITHKIQQGIHNNVTSILDDWNHLNIGHIYTSSVEVYT